MRAAPRRALSLARARGRRALRSLDRRPPLVVHGHSFAQGGGTQHPARERFTRRVADRLGLREVNHAVGGAVAHWSTGGGVGDGGYPLVLQDGFTAGSAEPYLPDRATGLLFFGLNDLAVLGERLRPYEEALRAMISRYRAARVYEAEDDESFSFAPGWRAVSGASACNSGSGYRETTSSAAATIAVPDDYDGTPIAVGFIVPPASQAVARVTVGPVPGRQAAEVGVDLSAARVCSEGRSNAVVKRLTDLTPGRHTIELEVEVTAGSARLDYWQVEAGRPPLVLVLEHFRLMTYDAYLEWPAHPLADQDVLEALNPSTRAVAGEFGPSVLCVETDSALGKDYPLAARGAVPGAYPDESGYRRLADHVSAQVEAAISRGASSSGPK